MSKFVGTGPSSYKKRIYRAAVSQKLRNTRLSDYHLQKYLPMRSQLGVHNGVLISP